MINIFKYKLEKFSHQIQKVQMPIGAKILSMLNQHEEIAIWAEVNATNISEARSFITLATGATKPDNPLKYFTTLQFSDGNYVVHVYELV